MQGKKMGNLDQLEKHLQALIEVYLLNYLPISKKENMVAQKLAAVIAKSDKIAPHAYTITAAPNLIEAWRGDSVLIDNFKEMLEAAATKAGLSFAAPLSFSLASDPKLGSDEIEVLVSQHVDNIAETKNMESQKTDSTEEVPNNAFLIIHGTKVFPLTKTVINIGRRMENDLTIDDPRVSRDHAQLRVSNGRFIIFDLNSTGGTYVNSQRSHQSVLYPGDVISLAGVPLIYGQDNPPHRGDLRETSPLGSPATSNRDTAFLPDTAQLDKKKK